MEGADCRGDAGGGSRRGRLCLVLAAFCLLTGRTWAVPSSDGLSGVIRLPSAYTATGSTTYKRKAGYGASFTYRLFAAAEAGATRENGEFGLHGKVQILPETVATPAIAFGAQDWTRKFGPRRYFWSASKRFESYGIGLHGGLKRADGFFQGAKDYFAGAEYDLLPMVRLKGEYDWGTSSGSSGVEVQFGSRLVVYDYVLDLFGSGRNASNLIGISFQGQF